MKRAFVLLSGGIDSTTCLHKAIVDFAPDLQGRPSKTDIDYVEAISVDYGQRHIKEAEFAAKTCAKFGIKHTILSTKILASNAMLTDKNVPIPSIDYADIKGVSPTYVPFRNGTLLAMITAHAQKWVNKQIEGLKKSGASNEFATMKMEDSCGVYFGAHAEDAANWAYSDCSPEFIGSMANAIYVGTYRAVRLYTPLEWLNKMEIIMLGQRLVVDWTNTWSCYAGEDLHCGVCPTCRSRRNGFKLAGVKDPTQYAADPERNVA